MVWPFSGSKRIHNYDKIQAHLQARDRALALALPPSSTVGKDEIEKSLNGSDAGEYVLNGMDISIKPLDRQILAADFASITGGIETRRWTAVDVLAAYIRSARRAHIRTNCITEVNLDHALVRAAELDKYFEQTGKLVGPLHGVPISIKEHYNMKGVPLSLGFTSWFTKPAPTESASIVLLAEHLGAIPFVKTNIPQTMLAFECQNPVFGRTLNPYSPHHSCGGSSGGEAALIASDGSPAGVGSDIGGSLRIPIGYCGLYSLKPSANVWPMAGSADFAKGFEGITAVPGPITRSAQDLEAFHSAIVQALQPPRPRVTAGDAEQAGDELAIATVEHDRLMKQVGLAGTIHSSYNPTWLQPLKVAEKRGTPLRVGYYFTDGFIKTTPACYRAVKESIEALRAKYPSQQVELVAIAPKDVQPVEGLEHFLGLSSADGYDYLTVPHLGKDRADPVLMLPLLLARLPVFLKRIIAFIARFVLRDARMARLVLAAGRRSAKKYFQVTESRTKFCDAWKKRVWDAYELDAIICPVQASPAVPHGGATNLAMMCIATALYNILDCAVATLPVTRVSAETDSHRAADFKNSDTAEATRSTYDEWSQDPELKKCSHLVNFELYTQGVYDAKKMAGLPVGVQVVARPYEEEKAIGIMRLLDDALPPAAQRGGGWVDQVDRNGRALEGAKATKVRCAGFGPGSYTEQVYGQAKA
ncbi:uncharacterized protein PFL1_00345 [Pseudozyma flocculosa PF-1]|uniref:Related to amidase (Acetamidase) n=1 Tax=Pseudozyma flocculosa TaxID=84751 RepID=A0A5C3ERG6_9BASI|nr:uncharacterized protein PFL1_00345 [Pseudozyma flocculosa PF-1]EPQ32148.1 hypothetical protein PFL1_00345 [Pseudozyma flocculosa PF-1]SPO34913.1 related to amidase (acetamidase) [Pseudozyma flocculosa]